MESVIIFGAGGLGRHAARRLMFSGNPPVAIADNDPKKQGGSYGGIPIVSLDEAVLLSKLIVIAVGTDTASRDICRELGKTPARYMNYAVFARNNNIELDSFMSDKELFYLGEMAASLKPAETWVEIGTWRGQSFEATANRIPSNCVLWAVDLWADCCVVFADWRSRLEHLQIRRRDVAMGMLQLSSLEAARRFPDRSLGGIFLDASHEYADVVADLNAWWPKLKPGGIFCGHDLGEEWPGVGRAAMEFAAQKGLRLKHVVDSLWRLES